MVSVKLFIRLKSLLVLLFILSPLDSHAFWVNYTYGDSVNGLAEEGNYIWSASKTFVYTPVFSLNIISLKFKTGG